MTILVAGIAFFRRFEFAIPTDRAFLAVGVAVGTGLPVLGTSVALFARLDNAIAAVGFDFLAVLGTAGAGLTVLITGIAFFSLFHNTISADADWSLFAVLGAARVGFAIVCS